MSCEDATEDRATSNNFTRQGSWLPNARFQSTPSNIQLSLSSVAITFLTPSVLQAATHQGSTPTRSTNRLVELHPMLKHPMEAQDHRGSAKDAPRIEKSITDERQGCGESRHAEQGQRRSASREMRAMGKRFEPSEISGRGSSSAMPSRTDRKQRAQSRSRAKR